MTVDFKEMMICYKLGLHETGYIVFGEPFLSIRDDTLNSVILPIIRRVMPAMIAKDIIGVQPMTGPIGQIHTLKTRYKC